MKRVFLYQILVFITHQKIKKSPCNNNKLKVSAETYNDKFELGEAHIPYQIFKIILSII